MTTRRLSVLDAAEYLGVSVNAVRMRIRRETLTSEKDEAGNVWVLVGDYSPDDSETTRQTNDPTSEHTEDLREQLAYLREIIATRDEELRRKDHIIMQMAQRIPELEAPDSRDDGYGDDPKSREESLQRDESPGEDTSKESAPDLQTDSQGPQRPERTDRTEQRTPWWRRIFGGG